MFTQLTHMPTLAKNKRARFDYEILETLEAGIVLTGAEVKSVKAGHLKLTEAYITFRGEVPYVTNLHISRYKKSDPKVAYDPTRARRILLGKRQIASLIGKKSRDGLTIVPLSAYTKGNLVKIEVGVGRGKKKHDKRASIKKRETDREVRRAIKNS